MFAFPFHDKKVLICDVAMVHPKKKKSLKRNPCYSGQPPNSRLRQQRIHHHLPFLSFCPISGSTPNISHFKDTAKSSMGILMRKAKFHSMNGQNFWEKNLKTKNKWAGLTHQDSCKLRHWCRTVSPVGSCKSQPRDWRAKDS